MSIANQVAVLLLEVQRLEAWYRCTNDHCRHGFFRDLTPNSTCPNAACRHRNPPLSEHVQADGVVQSTFRCLACGFKWTHQFSLTKTCNKCYRSAQPANMSDARGVGHARCSRCYRVSYDIDTRMGDRVCCRECRDTANSPVVGAMCSQQRRRKLDTLASVHRIALEPMQVVQQALYVSGTQRTRVTWPLERVLAVQLTSPLVRQVNTMVTVSPS